MQEERKKLTSFLLSSLSVAMMVRFWNQKMLGQVRAKTRLLEGQYPRCL